TESVLPRQRDGTFPDALGDTEDRSRPSRLDLQRRGVQRLLGLQDHGDRSGRAARGHSRVRERNRRRIGGCTSMNRAVLRRNLPTLLAACAIGGLTIALYAGINLGSMYAYGDLRPFSWYPARDPGAYFRAWQLSGLGNTEQLPPSEIRISTIEIVLPFPVALQHVMFLAELPMATISMFLLSRK